MVQVSKFTRPTLRKWYKVIDNKEDEQDLAGMQPVSCRTVRRGVAGNSSGCLHIVGLQEILAFLDFMKKEPRISLLTHDLIDCNAHAVR